MADPEPEASADESPPAGADGDETPPAGADGDETPPAGADGDEPPSDGGEAEGAMLREAVGAKYDFEQFTPADMAGMTVEEWQAAFDADAWITGPELIERVEAELRSRVADRQVFAVVERHDVDGESRLLAYTDAGYAVVHPDGTVVGQGGIMGEVEPVVALCSMDSFEVGAPPPDARLPDPEAVESGSGNLGHRVLLAVAGIQLVAGVVLLASPLVVSPGPGSGALSTVVGLAFLLVGLVVAVLVANARLSDRFRAAAYRDRLRAAGVGSDRRPEFLPPMDGSGAAGEPADDVDGANARADEPRGPPGDEESGSRDDEDGGGPDLPDDAPGDPGADGTGDGRGGE